MSQNIGIFPIFGKFPRAIYGSLVTKSVVGLPYKFFFGDFILDICPNFLFFPHFSYFFQGAEVGDISYFPSSGSNGERVKKCKVCGLFFYDTPFKNCIFSMVTLISRRSEYDFWIPDEILILETKTQIKTTFFSRSKILTENYYFLIEKKRFFFNQHFDLDFF